MAIKHRIMDTIGDASHRNAGTTSAQAICVVDEESDMMLVSSFRGALWVGTTTALAAALCGAMTMPAQARVPGKDGAVAVTAANTTVVNNYTTLSAAASAAGAATISVVSPTGITCPPANVIAFGFNREPG